MGKQYTVIVSERAKKMLGAHIHYLARIDKTAAAEKKAQLIRAMHSLESMPERFPFFNEPYMLPNQYHKLFVQKWYLILYQIRDDSVFVDYILDCRKDYSWLAE